jgi:hypothetical protein
MNSIKKLKENITSFLIEIAAYYGIPKSEIVSTIREINFYCLYQTLCREAMPVFAFHAYGDRDKNKLLQFSGERLFPCNAINLYQEPDLRAISEFMETVHCMEVWLREDLTLSVTSCFHVDNKEERYCTTYRVHKGVEWPFEEVEFDFDSFVNELIDAAPGITEGQPLFES